MTTIDHTLLSPALPVEPDRQTESPPLTVIVPRRGWAFVDLRELWQHRELCYFLIWRDLKVRYKQTVLGAAWALLQPIAAMLIFSVVFGTFARIPSDGLPYPLFAYAGVLLWLFFSSAVTQASFSLVNQSQLLTRVYFPRLIMPAAAIGAALVDFSLGLCPCVGLMLWYGYAPGPFVLALPVLILVTALVAWGLGALLAAATIAYRDFRAVVPFLLQIWMYATPVIYPLALVPERYRWLIRLNPLSGLIDAYRSALLNLPIDYGALGIATVTGLTLSAAGICIFRTCERRFADIV